MRLYTLLSEIISSLVRIRKKMVKLDEYWNVQHTLTATASSVASNYTISSATAYLLNNHMVIDVNFTYTGAQKASGSAINVALCTLTISGLQGLLTSGTTALTSNGTNMAAGPIITGSITNFSRTSDNVMTCICRLGYTAAGAMARNGSFGMRYVVTVCRDMTIS